MNVTIIYYASCSLIPKNFYFLKNNDYKYHKYMHTLILFVKFQNFIYKRIFSICECRDCSHILKHEETSEASAYVPFFPNLKIRACLQRTLNSCECQNYPGVSLFFRNLRIYELVAISFFFFFFKFMDLRISQVHLFCIFLFKFKNLLTR